MIKFLALAGAALLAAPAAAGNILLDGGFESAPQTPGGYAHHAGGGSLAGSPWHVTGVDVLTIDTAYVTNDSPPLAFRAHGGRTSLDLTGTGNSGPADGVFQDAATEIGETYELAFWVGHLTAEGYMAPAVMRVSIGDGALLDFVNDDVVANGLAWTRHALRFTATDLVTRVAFINGLGNDYLGLDDVSLINIVELPEPGLVILFAAGAFAILALRRPRPGAGQPSAIS